MQGRKSPHAVIDDRTARHHPGAICLQHRGKLLPEKASREAMVGAPGYRHFDPHHRRRLRPRALKQVQQPDSPSRYDAESLALYRVKANWSAPALSPAFLLCLRSTHLLPKHISVCAQYHKCQVSLDFWLRLRCGSGKMGAGSGSTQLQAVFGMHFFRKGK